MNQTLDRANVAPLLDLRLGRNGALGVFGEGVYRGDRSPCTLGLHAKHGSIGCPACHCAEGSFSASARRLSVINPEPLDNVWAEHARLAINLRQSSLRF